jgi:hypothetical protein
MSVMAHLRQMLARSPWIYWTVIGALALTVGLLANQAADRVDAARDAWGRTRSVLVAVVDIEPGDPLLGSVEERAVPGPLVPASALHELDDDAITARQRVAAGEMVMAHDVSAVHSPRALIPEGWLAVPIAERVAGAAAPGDAVAVSSGGVVLAANGIVVAAGDSSLLVAVPADAAPQVAQAATTGDASLLLRP